jgi:preprotein translocase subunit SecG
MGLMSGRQKASFMTRTTAILATLFMLNSLAFSVIVSRNSAVNLVDDVAKEMKKDGELSAPKADAVTAPLADVPTAKPVEAAKPAETAKPVAAEKTLEAPKADAKPATDSKKK